MARVPRPFTASEHVHLCNVRMCIEIFVMYMWNALHRLSRGSHSFNHVIRIRLNKTQNRIKWDFRTQFHILKHEWFNSCNLIRDQHRDWSQLRSGMIIHIKPEAWNIMWWLWEISQYYVYDEIVIRSRVVN